MKPLLVQFLTIFMFLFSVSINAQTLEELLKGGDQLVMEFKNKEALDVYNNANQKFPNNWEVLWRISRAYVDIGEHMPDKTDEQQDAQSETYQKAFDYADKSVTLAPDQAITYVRRAIANGYAAHFLSTLPKRLGPLIAPMRFSAAI